ncbi:MAG: GAF domain-containing protein [Deltaproteobacteria bacterium]|nr:GAF domain-containing protein [Deltaproteobacteria bacterium]
MVFVITANTGESVKISAENWLVAMGQSLVFFDADLGELSRWEIVSTGDGAVFIDDRIYGRSWSIDPAPERPPLRIVAATPAVEEEPLVEEDDAPEERSPLGAPPPMFAMPSSSFQVDSPEEPQAELEDEPTADLAEQLFDLSMEMAGLDPDEACKVALDILLERVTCEAASVLRGGLNDVAMRFVATHGPVAEALIGKSIPFGKGLVGLSFDRGMTLVVNDVRDDSRHLNRVDEQTGFVTRAVLTVPVVGSRGAFGVVQLINPSRPFSAGDVEVVEMVAQSLGEVLGGQG